MKTTLTTASLFVLCLLAVPTVDGQTRRDADENKYAEETYDFVEYSEEEGDLTEESILVASATAFGNKVAGTYLDNGVIGAGAFTGMQTLGARGTQTATNSNAFGVGDSLLQGPAHGAWIKTGPQQITINSVIQIFLPPSDTDGDGTLETGGPGFITARVQVVVDFLDNDFTTANAELTTELYWWATPGDASTAPDVQNDTPTLVVCGTATWSKLQVDQGAHDRCDGPASVDGLGAGDCVDTCPPE